MDLTGIGSVANLAKSIFDKFVPDKESYLERMAVELEIQKMVNSVVSEEIASKKDVIVSELKQDDIYTKRARPTIVYIGLVCIVIVHVLFPIITFFTGKTPPDIALPEEFWWMFSGVCSVWVFGRSAEKIGSSSSIVKKITGAK